MANVGTMKDVYVVARHVRIAGEAIDRFVKTLEAAGYEIRHKDDAPPPEGGTFEKIGFLQRPRDGEVHFVQEVFMIQLPVHGAITVYMKNEREPQGER